MDLILKENPKSKLHAMTPAKYENKIQLWALDVDKLIRIDGQKPPDIESVIKYATSDETFWKANILSGDAVRRNWDRLILQTQRSKKPVNRVKQPPPPNTAGIKYIVHSGLKFEDNEAVMYTPEAVMKLFKVDPVECLIESDRAPLSSKGIDPAQFISLRPQVDDIYDLQREIDRQRSE